MKRVKSPGSEELLTETVANYCDLLVSTKKIKCFTHVNNEQYTKSWGIKLKNKRMGVRPGVPDMIIVGKSKLLFLELKRVKGGVVSDYQKEWLEALESLGSPVEAIIAKGWDEARKAIDSVI